MSVVAQPSAPTDRHPPGGMKKGEEEPTAAELKALGNAAFKAKDFMGSIILYTQAINAAEAAKESPGVYFNNRAFAHFKLESYGAAEQDAGKAVEHGFYKGYYRRGQALFAMTKIEEALKMFKLAKKHYPKNKDVISILKTAQKAVREKKFLEAIRKPEQDVLKDFNLENFSQPLKSYSGPIWPEEEKKTVTAESSEAKPEGEKAQSDNRNAPLSREFVIQTTEHFKDLKNLPPRYVALLLLRLIPHLEKLPNCVDFNTFDNDSSPDSHVTVCGDTHGQFFDLLNIFKLNGWPSKKNPYVFNGDFVDRGAFSCEVILTLLLWKAHDFDCMHLTRGNHEGLSMNTMYGFKAEVDKKYSGLFDLFTELFNRLPLSYRINKKILVLHGGLFSEDGVTLADIQKVDRVKQIPDSGIMCEMLWSDPADEPGRTPSKRGVGVHFGPDVSKRFLEENDLDLLIRSHEMKNDGFHWQHDKKVLTVFSAPNYVDQMGNKGAYLRIGNDGVAGMQIKQFSAVPHPQVRPSGMMGMFR